SSRRRHTRLQGDWSSDLCSSDLGKILVGRALHVLGRIEIGEHRRTARDLDEKIAEIPSGETMEKRKLLLHLTVVANLLLTGGEEIGRASLWDRSCGGGSISGVYV